jgi:1-acyl-sn-glycerol-3-phosphate acyltransferase
LALFLPNLWPRRLWLSRLTRAKYRVRLHGRSRIMKKILVAYDGTAPRPLTTP